MQEAYRAGVVQRRAAQAASKSREEKQGKLVRSAVEFQDLVAYLLEGTLFNLVSEVSLGETALDAVPRQIVRSLEITPDVA